MTKRILVIPDTQVRPGVPTDHLEWAGKYAAAKKPDVIVHIGDHWDMPSLSSYDVGKKSFEGRRYTSDIESGNAAMDLFMSPIHKEKRRLSKNKKAVWNPRLIYTTGNHCYRIDRAIESDAVLEGVISRDDFNLAEHGWEVYPFLQPVVVEGVAFAHYFCSGVMGRPVTNAKLMLQKKHMSCVQGHVQSRDIAYSSKANGKRMTGIFAGIFYQHDEEYLNAQTNRDWRGIWMLHEVNDGEFDEHPISLDYLGKKYGGWG